MKRVLLLTPVFYPSIGGTEEQVKLLGEEFIRLGYTVDIITYKKGRQERQEKIFGMNIFTFGGFFDFLRFFTKNKNYDIIISRQYYRHSFYLGIGKFLKIIKDKSVVCTDSGGDKDEICVIKSKSYFLYKIYFFFIAQNDYLNCLNNDNIRHLQNIYKGKPKYLDKITNIYNGIDISSFEKTKKKKNIKNILFLGRFEKEKGIFETIKAFKNIENRTLQLHLIGYGEKKGEQEIKSLIKNDARILFHGKKYGEEKQKIIDGIDLFVFPTYYPEGQPVTLTEMAIKNIPIISTDIANTKDIYGDNILYVEKKNEADLQKKMEWIIENISDFSYNYTEALKKIDVRNIVRKFLDLK
ncbi:hypothetical protein CSB09_03040 [Candidatus Gracilibacteria bacterium]|nr:MAG: hypothetical protein CSB09_03040 [Candidatus Gracilibacteria bacterium]